MPNTQVVITPATIVAPVLVECHGCGELCAARHLHELEDDLFCFDCMAEKGYVQCHDCHNMVDENDTRMTAGSDTICDDCYDENYFQCDRCDDIYRTDRSVTPDSGRDICEYCYENHYFRCEDCENIYHNDDLFSTDDGCYCESCHSEHERVCDSCHEHSSGSLTHVRGIGDVCSDCRPRNPINQYSFKPEPIFFDVDKVLTVEEAQGKTFLGIELEISCSNVCNSLNVFNEEDMERFYMKDDASVPEGFEIVSHPMTIAEHRNFGWDKLCKNLIKSGAVGDKNNHGIHIHISKGRLSDLHCLKLSWFLCHQFDEIVRLTRRDHCYHEDRCVDSIIEAIKQKQKYKNPNRNEMLNWSNSHTVEFRLPKSTLRHGTILATLEFCDAAVKFVQTDVNFITLQDCWEQFMTWCNDNGYKCLVGYYLFYGENGYDEI